VHFIQSVHLQLKLVNCYINMCTIEYLYAQVYTLKANHRQSFQCSHWGD